MGKKVRLGLVASGSGTDANAIMEAYRQGKIENAEPVVLISTKPGAGCLEKAEASKIPSRIVDRKGLALPNFTLEFTRVIYEYEVKMVFLVGCVVVFNPPPGITVLNIHPADPLKHGGHKMYGLTVHQHVLADIKDQIVRKMRSPTDRFFTYPTVHEVIGQEKPDQGQILLQAAVEIPKVIIQMLVFGSASLEVLAEELQKYVLPYEWLMLPTAVEMAARRILFGEEGLKQMSQRLGIETHNKPPNC